ncbi:hypothetical protein ACFYO1_23905 [Nocardia sp. NPDC006044]|uniref:hypothetical protein n=1 Tax=Nocardia sp. NPDC006044 TaxID=3364306 RepID=UPI00367AC546
MGRSQKLIGPMSLVWALGVAVAAVVFMLGTLSFDLWRVQVETQFPHPDSGTEACVRKQFLYPKYREVKARALAERLSAGSSVPIVVRKNSALFDIPERPIWIDIW